MLYKAKKLKDKEIAKKIEHQFLKLPADILKIHLYLVKAGLQGEIFSTEHIADSIGTTEKKVERVLNEWMEAGLLKEAEAENIKNEALSICLYFYGLLKGEDADLAEIADISLIHEKYQMDSDLFFFLTEYCSKKRKLNTSYMAKIAEDWYKNGIQSRDQAEEFIENRSGKMNAVKKAFGIHGRNLAPAELNYVKKWNFPADMIALACTRALTHTGKPSFQYADAILKNWEEKGIRSMEAAENDLPTGKEKSNSSNQFHNFEQRTYDYDSLEQLLIKQQQKNEE